MQTGAKTTVMATVALSPVEAARPPQAALLTQLSQLPALQLPRLEQRDLLQQLLSLLHTGSQLPWIRP